MTQAFGGVGQQISQINTGQLAQSLQTLSDAFATTPPYVRSALRGLAALSSSVASRDATVTSLLAGARKVTGTLAGQDARFQALLGDGNLLLAELRQRQQAIHAMLVDTQALAIQLSGLVNDDQARLGPALQALNQVTSVLQANQANLQQALALAGPYYRLLGNAIGTGRWFDVYLCGLMPKSYAPGNTPAHGCQPPEALRMRTRQCLRCHVDDCDEPAAQPAPGSAGWRGPAGSGGSSPPAAAVVAVRPGGRRRPALPGRAPRQADHRLLHRVDRRLPGLDRAGPRGAGRHGRRGPAGRRPRSR